MEAEELTTIPTSLFHKLVLEMYAFKEAAEDELKQARVAENRRETNFWTGKLSRIDPLLDEVRKYTTKEA